MSAHFDGFDALRITDLLHGDRMTPLGFVVTPAGATEPVRRFDTDDEDDEDDDEDDEDEDDDFDDDDLDDDEDAPEDEDGDAHDEGGED